MSLRSVWFSGRLKRAIAPPANAVIKNYSSTKEATFEVKNWKFHRLESDIPKTSTTLNAKDALNIYENLVMARRMENAGGSLYKEKKIRGFCHLYIGQEAVAIGLHAAMREQDSVITAYRCHVWTYLMGVSLVGILAELTGRQSGCSRGKGGSMHMYCRNFYGGNGIVGAQVPLGAGLALAHQYKKDGGVCFSLYGDGASNQGQVFEAYNIAALWDLPVVFICENNGYGMGTKADRSSASIEYYTRGDYIPGLWVDGMDVLATREAGRFVINYCTSGKGPLVMEMSTYRYQGHSMSDPGTSYRSREEVQEVRQTRDPITQFKQKIIKSTLVTEDQLEAIDARVKKEVEEAVKIAVTDPEAPLQELTTDVYAKPLGDPIRNTVPDKPLAHSSLAQRKQA